MQPNDTINALQRLNEIGVALSSERNLSVLLEKILIHAKALTHADGGTIYLITPQGNLKFEIMMTDSLGFHFGGTSSKQVTFSPIPLHNLDGTLNDKLVVAYAVNHKTTVHIKDAYFEEGFDFSGTKLFDANTGYRTRNVLAIPMKNHENKVIAVLQLINPYNDQLKVFSEEDIHLAESLASQAGIALNNQILIDNLKQLFESLIKVIADAIDEKSPVTGNHGKRVPIIAMLLADEVNAITEGPFKDITFSPSELYELKIAAFLHDCGKIVTPVHIIEKHTKLETIHDRIQMIDARFAFLQEEAEKKLLLQKMKWIKEHTPEVFSKCEEACVNVESEYLHKMEELNREKEWLHLCNAAIEPITNEAVQRLKACAAKRWFEGKPLLSEDELENLLVEHGNLTENERAILKQHVVMTYRMLSQLPFPEEMRTIPEIAASHHERMDGKGYPRGLKGDQLSIRARILSIADIFEALSAPDRPYKKPLPLSQILKMLQDLVKEGALDGDLVDLFIKKKTYLKYANQYLSQDQIDV